MVAFASLNRKSIERRRTNSPRDLEKLRTSLQADRRPSQAGRFTAVDMVHAPVYWPIYDGWDHEQFSICDYRTFCFLYRRGHYLRAGPGNHCVRPGLRWGVYSTPDPLTGRGGSLPPSQKPHPRCQPFRHRTSIRLPIPPAIWSRITGLSTVLVTSASDPLRLRGLLNQQNYKIKPRKDSKYDKSLFRSALFRGGCPMRAPGWKNRPVPYHGRMS